jgi:hypothetical protein
MPPCPCSVVLLDLLDRVPFGKFNRAGKEGYHRSGGSLMGLSQDEFCRKG